MTDGAINKLVLLSAALSADGDLLTEVTIRTANPNQYALTAFVVNTPRGPVRVRFVEKKTPRD